MARNRLVPFAFLAMVCGAAVGSEPADDTAFLADGTRLTGSLQGAGPIRFVNNAGKTWTLDQLQQVRFAPNPCPPPAAPISQRLLLSEEQWLSGELLAIDAEVIRFRAWTGTEVKVPRKSVQAIAQPADWHVLYREDFEKEPVGWRFNPADAVRTDSPFTGKKSLILDRSGQEAIWTPAEPPASGRASFFLRQGDKLTNHELHLEWTLRKDKQTRLVQIKVDGKKFSATKPAGFAVDAKPGWHLVQMEISESTLRLSVDDLVLHSERTEAGWTLSQVKFAVHQPDPSQPGSGFWSVDDVQLCRRETVLPWPRPLADADAVWLAEGDQLFGAITKGDAQAVTLDARFGTRSIPWSAMRGLIFMNGKIPAKPAPADAWTLWVAPSPGLPADRVVGKVLAVSPETLTVRHDILGDLTFPRKSCVKLIRSANPP